MLNSKDVMSEELYINDIKANYYIKDNHRTLIYINDDSIIYIMSSNMDKLQLLDIAKSIKNITL